MKTGWFKLVALHSFILAVIFSGCGSGNPELTLNAHFLTSTLDTLTQAQYACDTVVFVSGQDNNNLLSLPSNHIVPVGASNVPINGTLIQILQGASVADVEGTLTVQVTCNPAGQNIINFSIFNIFLGTADFTTGACGSGCEVDVELNGIDPAIVDTLQCPTLTTLIAILAPFCDTGTDPNSTGCVLLELVQDLFNQQGCNLGASP